MPRPNESMNKNMNATAAAALAWVCSSKQAAITTMHSEQPMLDSIIVQRLPIRSI